MHSVWCVADTVQTKLGAGEVGELFGSVWFGLGFLRQFYVSHAGLCLPSPGVRGVHLTTPTGLFGCFNYKPGSYLCMNYDIELIRPHVVSRPLTF